jgi:hypothetical protein
MVLQIHQISISKSNPCDRLSWSARSGTSFPQFEAARDPLGSTAPTGMIALGFPQGVEKVWESFSFFRTDYAWRKTRELG